MNRVSKKKKDQARTAYLEGGRAIGRQILYDPLAESRVWKLVGGLKLWPRWYLKAFARLYAEENPSEYERIRKKRYRQHKTKESNLAKLSETREQAIQDLGQFPCSQ